MWCTNPSSHECVCKHSHRKKMTTSQPCYRGVFVTHHGPQLLRSFSLCCPNGPLTPRSAPTPHCLNGYTQSTWTHSRRKTHGSARWHLTTWNWNPWQRILEELCEMDPEEIHLVDHEQHAKSFPWNQEQDWMAPSTVDTKPCLGGSASNLKIFKTSIDIQGKKTCTQLYLFSVDKDDYLGNQDSGNVLPVGVFKGVLLTSWNTFPKKATAVPIFKFYMWIFNLCDITRTGISHHLAEVSIIYNRLVLCETRWWGRGSALGQGLRCLGSLTLATQPALAFNSWSVLLASIRGIHQHSQLWDFSFSNMTTLRLERWLSDWGPLHSGRHNTGGSQLSVTSVPQNLKSSSVLRDVCSSHTYT